MKSIKQLNNNLIKGIKKRGFLKNKSIVNAFENTYRSDFLPYFYIKNNDILQRIEKEKYMEDEELLKYIYTDRSIIFFAENNNPVSSISQPSLIAIMIELANIKQNDKVMEIGSGSGFNAALISKIVGEHGFVFTNEINRDIFYYTQNNIKHLNIKNIYINNQDGGYGLKDFCPYDSIIVTCSTADITKYWIEQLKIGGTLVAPLITRGLETLICLKKVREDYLEGYMYYYVNFYHLQGPFSILTHYSYTKQELKTINKIISHYAIIDEDFSYRLKNIDNKQLNDFFLYLAIHNPHSICYFNSKQKDKEKKGYGILLKTTSETGLALIINKKLYRWGNNDAYKMLLNEFNRFKQLNTPNINSYRLKVYSSDNYIYTDDNDIIISRKNSATIFERLY